MKKKLIAMAAKMPKANRMGNKEGLGVARNGQVFGYEDDKEGISYVDILKYKNINELEVKEE